MGLGGLKWVYEGYGGYRAEEGFWAYENRAQ